VLADWLITVGESCGWYVQSTSVPGVAQRTGSTVYYLEMVPEAQLNGRTPVLALMPAPGDVDVVVAFELMEAGRAVLRGFVTPDRTALIASAHRIYSIAEKSALSGGIRDGSKAFKAARECSRSLLTFDMEEVAQRTGSAISAVMLGAIAASEALPFPRKAFEDAIRTRGISVKASLAGFAAGCDAAAHPIAACTAPMTEEIVEEGVRRLVDYQDDAYAALYRRRLEDFTDPIVKREVARTLALWMSYEDVMRVAQQKTRVFRMDKIRAEVKASPEQILQVTEYMHPRWQEVCDSLPAGLGKRLADDGILKRTLAPFFERGRFVKTTSVSWFLLLSWLASRRRTRRNTLRYKRENAAIEAWLATIAAAARDNIDAAIELARCQDLIKGYGETHERGLRKFNAIMNAWHNLKGNHDAAEVLRSLRGSAFEDEEGTALSAKLKAVARKT
jgi:indolepyruvate ferredoxin oxidoreductase beta subunit